MQYMHWDKKEARFHFDDREADENPEGDWIYLRLNVRVQYHLKYLYWGEIDDHVKWTIDNFNGLEFIDNLAQISLCAEGDNIRIFVFG